MFNWLVFDIQKVFSVGHYNSIVIEVLKQERYEVEKRIMLRLQKNDKVIFFLPFIISIKYQSGVERTRYQVLKPIHLINNHPQYLLLPDNPGRLRLD